MPQIIVWSHAAALNESKRGRSLRRERVRPLAPVKPRRTFPTVCFRAAPAEIRELCSLRLSTLQPFTSTRLRSFARSKLLWRTSSRRVRTNRSSAVMSMTNNVIVASSSAAQRNNKTLNVISISIFAIFHRITERRTAFGVNEVLRKAARQVSEFLDMKKFSFFRVV